jgi:hypothetical protein
MFGRRSRAESSYVMLYDFFVSLGMLAPFWVEVAALEIHKALSATPVCASKVYLSETVNNNPCSLGREALNLGIYSSTLDKHSLHP